MKKKLVILSLSALISLHAENPENRYRVDAKLDSEHILEAAKLIAGNQEPHIKFDSNDLVKIADRVSKAHIPAYITQGGFVLGGLTIAIVSAYLAKHGFCNQEKPDTKDWVTIGCGAAGLAMAFALMSYSGNLAGLPDNR